MLRRFRVRPAVPLLLALAAACRSDAPAPPVRLAVAPGSTAGALTLRVTAPPVASLRVARSRLSGGRYAGTAGRTYWFLAPAAGAASAALPAEVHFGHAPPGFTGTTPVALGPGRYEVEVVAAGRRARSYFRVADDGAVR